MLVFECNVCRTPLSAEQAQAGQLVRCPKCLSTLRVPAGPVPAAAAMGGGTVNDPSSALHNQPATLPNQQRTTTAQPSTAGTLVRGYRVGGSNNGQRFGFNCGYCSSRLEANEGMSGQEGQCPTCGNAIIIPILDRYGRLIDPMTGKIIKPDPHPVHAYAAAGERAPRILRDDHDKQTIMCPRCQSLSPISANNCRSCGMPFTMEGTTLDAAGSSNGFCVASLVLGIIGIPAFVCFPVALLALVFGIIGYHQANKFGAEGSGKGMAIAGIICGIIGCAIGAISYLN